VGGQGALTDELPAGGLGARIGATLPDRGQGRWMVAGGGLYRVGPSMFRVSELLAQLGYLRNLPTAGPGVLVLGPTIGLGPLWRSSTPPEPIEPVTFVGTFGDLALRGAYLRGPVQVSLEAGVRALPLSRDGGLPLHLAPLLSLGVGPGL
jgi:hypothetical protein